MFKKDSQCYFDNFFYLYADATMMKVVNQYVKEKLLSTFLLSLKALTLRSNMAGRVQTTREAREITGQEIIVNEMQFRRLT